ncbi:MAG: glutamate--tRNA ligase [Candidatus Doudnabacteria bacterium]|nr:glutamate--tRNA ligase [Candidatus Doudnabacteria bacterium]
MLQEVKTRFAPSPTGLLHVGGIRTALYNFLFARKSNGQMFLRIEDTDKARTVPGALENIIETLHNFGLKPDAEPVFQSSRLDIYKKFAEELIEKKSAYYCFCSTQRLEELRKQQEANHQPPKYDKLCLNLSSDQVIDKLKNNEPYVVRLNVPADLEIRFTDLVHGEINISSNEVDDQVLLKSDGYPTYHLANVVDDHEMQITHVIRGEEWVPSTPKHILLYSAFGWESPQFAHLPLLLSKTKKKLSKREGDVSVQSFMEQGYLPEALLNFVALLGWNPKTEQEIFTMDELIQQFSLDKVNKAGAVFDLDKLDWVNSVYIRKLSLDELLEKIKPFWSEAGKHPRDFILKILELERERLKKLSEIGERVKYFFEEPEYSAELLIWKKSDKQTIKQNLEKLLGFFNSNDPTEENIKKFIADNGMKTGEVLWPLRVALTGLEASPGPFEIISTFIVLPTGKEMVLNRIKKAVTKL